jgi:hypothetical protein
MVDVRYSTVDDEHTEFESPYCEDHGMFGDKDPFAASYSFIVDFWCQGSDVVGRHEV